MNDDNSAPAMFIGCVLAFILGVAFGGWLAEGLVRKQAVKAGVAEWRATPEGDVTFHWKEPKK